MPKVRVKTKKVHEFLLYRNISQNELATRLGTSQGYLSQLLNGHRCAGPEVRERLMDVLRIQRFEELFEVVPDPGSAEE